MEPLVIFGAGLVIYCGYLAIMDEIRDLKRCYARRRAACKNRPVKIARSVVRPLSGQGRGYSYSRRYACSGKLLAPQPH